MKATIMPGAQIYQDQHFPVWNEKFFPGMLNTLFECTKMDHNDRWKCVSFGFGLQGCDPRSYGNGPLFVSGDHLIPFITESAEEEMKTQGAKHDDGKHDWSLLPPDATEEVIRVYEHGVNKYGRDNWRKGLYFSRIFSAIMRHLWAWWKGADRNAEDANLKHLAQAAWGCLTLLEYTKNSKYGLFDNRLVEDCAPVDEVSIPSVWIEPISRDVKYTITCTPPPPEGETWMLYMPEGSLEIRRAKNV